MTQQPPISQAFYSAMEAIASVIPQRPFPPGLTTVEAGDWKLTVNSSGEEQDHGGTKLPPWSVLAEHKVWFVICVLDPNGGCIGGGMTEDEFIRQMDEIAREQAA